MHCQTSATDPKGYSKRVKERARHPFPHKIALVANWGLHQTHYFRPLCLLEACVLQMNGASWCKITFSDLHLDCSKPVEWPTMTTQSKQLSHFQETAEDWRSFSSTPDPLIRTCTIPYLFINVKTLPCVLCLTTWD